MPAITLCANGHNICNIYKLKITHCPTSRQQFLNIRNVAIEKLATEMKYSCVYRNYGCMETYSFDLIGKHQEKCQYIPQPCPVNKLNLGSWSGISSQMNSHLKQAHPHVCVWNIMVVAINHLWSSVSHLAKSTGKWYSFTGMYFAAAVRSKMVYFILFCIMLLLP